MGIVINGKECGIERHHLHTLIEQENPTADIAQALLELDESNNSAATAIAD